MFFSLFKAAFFVSIYTALTDFKGLTTFICYRRISYIANLQGRIPILQGPRQFGGAGPPTPSNPLGLPATPFTTIFYLPFITLLSRPLNTSLFLLISLSGNLFPNNLQGMAGS